MNKRLYTYRQLPTAYVVEDEQGQFWIVPASQYGWEQRRPFHGYRQFLERVYPNLPHVEAVIATSAGIPVEVAA